MPASQRHTVFSSTPKASPKSRWDMPIWLRSQRISSGHKRGVVMLPLRFLLLLQGLHFLPRPREGGGQQVVDLLDDGDGEGVGAPLTLVVEEGHRRHAPRRPLHEEARTNLNRHLNRHPMPRANFGFWGLI